MAGPFFKADCLYNSNLELIDLYAGDPIQEYYAAIPAAQAAYGISPITDMDIVIVNANAKASEATIATGFGAMALRLGAMWWSWTLPAAVRLPTICLAPLAPIHTGA